MGVPDECLLVAALETLLPTRADCRYQRNRRGPAQPPTAVGISMPSTYQMPRNGAASSGQWSEYAGRRRIPRRSPPPRQPGEGVSARALSSPRRCRRTAEWISARCGTGRRSRFARKSTRVDSVGRPRATPPLPASTSRVPARRPLPAPSQAANPAAPAARRPPGRWRRALRRTLPWPGTSAPTSPAPVSASVRAIRKSKVSRRPSLPARRSGTGAAASGCRRLRFSPVHADLDRRRRHAGQSARTVGMERAR